MMEELDKGIRAFGARAWASAYECLARADARDPLQAAHLEMLAEAAYLLGRDDDYFRVLERAHAEHVANGEHARAIRCAFWLGLNAMFRGEIGRGTGWLARAQRLLKHAPPESAVHGYLLVPLARKHSDAQDYDAAFAAAEKAAELGERAGEDELIAVARHVQGRTRLLEGRVAEGLALLDEAMVLVQQGLLGSVSAGLVYCSVIDGCQEVYALDRAREWTDALGRWCDEQPDMVAFTGRCLAHRAEILRLEGAWTEAMREAQRATDRFVARGDEREAGRAYYERAEIHRLRGDLDAAEQAFAEASARGHDVQPGFARLRLAQGRTEAARAGIHTALGAAGHVHARPPLLFAQTEILLAAGDVEEAERAVAELEEIAQRLDTPMLGAMATQSRGELLLARGEPEAALSMLRQARDQWRGVRAPYHAARARVLLGLACRALADEDGAQLELGAARAALEELGAAVDPRCCGASSSARERSGSVLSPRECEVLRLVAEGLTNRMIAEELGLSVKTVDRHVSNIFRKIDVSSRAAATAWAYQHAVVDPGDG
jgi:DNA-binding CsgD family transcriptional regulator/tetratricopeptide (TPR) repeat protein